MSPTDPPAPWSAPPDVLDADALWRNLEGDEAFLAELVQKFVQTLPGITGALRSAAARGDAAALYEAAHKLKGSVGVFYATGAASATLALLHIAERACAAGGDLRGAEESIVRVQHEVERLLGVLRSLAGVTP